MTNGKSLNIHPIGLSQNEMRMLKSICHVSSLSALRHRRYKLEASGLDSDIFIVNGDCPLSLDAWQARLDRDEKPTLFLSKDGQAAQANVVSRPPIPSRLLSALDFATC